MRLSIKFPEHHKYMDTCKLSLDKVVHGRLLHQVLVVKGPGTLVSTGPFQT